MNPIEREGSDRYLLTQRAYQIRKLISQLKKDGLTFKKFNLTLQNLNKSNSAIDFYVKKNINENTSVLDKKKSIIINEIFFNQPEEVKFYITKPLNGEPATFGNGSQVTFLAKSRDVVDKFYKIAISKGAIDEGSPGVRNDGNYYAYVRDIDGNKIAAKYILN